MSYIIKVNNGFWWYCTRCYPDKNTPALQVPYSSRDIGEGDFFLVAEKEKADRFATKILARLALSKHIKLYEHMYVKGQKGEWAIEELK